MVIASAVLFSLLFADDTNVVITGKNLSYKDASKWIIIKYQENEIHAVHFA